MATYKGNAGHLMQHWTLCELVDIACKHGVPGLSFVDAHAMAPIAQQRERRGAGFDLARNASPGQ